jgi:hypothetical protein
MTDIRKIITLTNKVAMEFTSYGTVGDQAAAGDRVTTG